MLKSSTIIRAFVKQGFVQRQGHPEQLSYLHNQFTGAGLHLTVSTSKGIVVEDARWKKRGNVHIVSYWHWPRTMRELDALITDMKAVYTELCGTRF